MSTHEMQKTGRDTLKRKQFFEVGDKKIGPEGTY